MATQTTIITAEDLRAFHAKHFPTAKAPEPVIYEAAANVEEEYYDPEDDGLGYYDDGVKRTLTDEQIALFRHTEIQTILRKRRLRKENGLSPEPEISPPPPPREKTPAVQPGLEGYAESDDDSSHQGANEVLIGPMPAPATSAEKGDYEDGVQSGRIEKQREWRKNSKQQAKKNAKNRKANRKNRSEKRKQGREGTGGDSESDEWDPWHQANGPDVQKDASVELDY